MLYVLALFLTNQNECVLTMPFDKPFKKCSNFFGKPSTDKRVENIELRVCLNCRRNSTKRLYKTQKVTKIPFLRRFRVLYNDLVA